MQKVVSLELNELNFDFVEAYAAKGRLPNFARLLSEYELVETVSEDGYPLLEPWIQWPTVYTGKTYAEHGIFRLGDAADKQHEQIWEALEELGISVGAISPMNAANRCSAPDFFVPDPWTVTKVSGDPSMERLYALLRAAVNDNAHQKSNMVDLAAKLLPFLVKHARPGSWKSYLQALRYAKPYKWARAAFLDRFLADLFLNLRDKKGTQFGSLFLNAGAHIQHHHMYEAEVYSGDQRNPSWYSTAKDDGVDPLLFVYQMYDGILADMLALDDTRVLISTGLSQVPNPKTIYQYRFTDHRGSLEKLGITGFDVVPRMSRDFLLVFPDAASAAAAKEAMLAVSCAGAPLFTIETRETSLFCQIGYFGPAEGFREVKVGDRSFDLTGDVVLVSIENGIHRTIGYHVDTARPSGGDRTRKTMPLSAVFDTMRGCFAHPGGQAPAGARDELVA